jgi:glucokinase
MLDRSKIEGIGIAMPGPFNYEKGISLIQNQHKYDSLYGLNVKDLLSQKLGLKNLKLTLKNDASCFLLGEVYGGSMVGFNNLIGITLGTGLGSAHYSNGVVKDANLWKMPFLKSIAEDYISTRWFIRRWAELTQQEIKGIKEIIDSDTDEEKFKLLFDEFSENLSQFLYTFIKKKRPSAVVLGGNIMNAERFFLQQTKKKLFNKMGISIPVTKSIQGEVATLLGAASLIKS